MHLPAALAVAAVDIMDGEAAVASSSSSPIR